ncbi:MAG TPA: hypothetical protein VHB54_00470, partial [Mucilaginibacter sp.]|nr:hypothetical protein [Mucilaginibacter sp.]
MKNFICACVITILAFQTIALAQSINLPADTVTKLLCKKWEIDYAVFQGQKIVMPSSTPKVYMEFYKDGTFSIIGGEPDA